MTRSTLRNQHSARLAGVSFLAMSSVAGIACAPQAPTQAPAASVAVQPATNGTQMPMAVNCGVGQQALIRPSLVNGQAVSQVDCVPAAAPAMAPVPAPAPAYVVHSPGSPVYQPVAASQAPVEAERVQVIERPAPGPAARPASYRTGEEVYVPARQQGRTWKKSALIIGSSAGIGAGVGAATGGKKGALIGAAIGGGGATIWDQVTRRR